MGEDVKVVFRKYESGETVAILPYESGDPEGKTAVAYASTGGFYMVYPHVVVNGSAPAVARDYNRLKKYLATALGSDDIEVLEELPSDAEAYRLANPEAYKGYGRVARSHAHR
jgi:hypothetical protein